MPSKTNERFMRADRKNRIETARLQQVKRLYDRSKTTLTLEIEREKRQLAKSFETVKRTSGTSEQGVPPKNENDRNYENSPNYKMGLRLSEMRLLEWKNSEKQLDRFLVHCEAEMNKIGQCRRHSSPDMNRKYVSRPPSSIKATQSLSSFGMDTEISSKNIDDDVFCEDGIQNGTTEVFRLDAEKLEKEITEQYKSLFKNTKVKIDRYSKKLNRKTVSDSDAENIENGKRIRFRPHTASAVLDNRRKVSTQSLPARPTTAHGIQPSYVQSFIIAKDGAYINTGKRYRKIHLGIQQNTNEQILNGDTPEQSGPSSTVLPTVGESGEELEGSVLEPNGNESCISNEESNCGIMTMILEESDESSNLVSGKEDGDQTLQETNSKEAILADLSDNYKRRLSLMQKGRKRSNTVSSGSEPELLSTRSGSDDRPPKENYSYLSRLVSARQRFGSTSTLMSDQGHSLMSEMYSSTSDMSVGSDGQRRPSRWREFIGTDTVHLPQNRKLATVGAVVKAALAFSKSARKKALEKLVDEQSADSRELIRQERLRRLESRNNVLSTIASQWGLNPEVNSVQEVSEEI